MSIQGLRRFTSDPAAHERRIAGITTELDDCIRQLRDTIYSLQARGAGQELLSGRVLRAVQESAGAAGVLSRVQLAGPVDEAVGHEVAEELLPVLHESVSNAVRNSCPTRKARPAPDSSPGRQQPWQPTVHPSAES